MRGLQPPTTHDAKRYLAAAVITQVVDDLRGSSHARHTIDIAIDRRAALDWLCSDEDVEFWCDIADIQPTALLSRAKELVVRWPPERRGPAVERLDAVLARMAA